MLPTGWLVPSVRAKSMGCNNTHSFASRELSIADEIRSTQGIYGYHLYSDANLVTQVPRRNRLSGTTPTPLVAHPYVHTQPGLAGGSPVIVGTKFPVRSVVVYVLRQGMTPEELSREFSQLSLPKIYDALSYYYDHKSAIDAEIADNDESVWQQKG